MSNALAENLSEVKHNQYIDTSLENLVEEIDQLQLVIAKQLDAETDTIELAQSLESAAMGKLFGQLEQIAGALSILDITAAAKLVEYIKQALHKLAESAQPATIKQRQAVFEGSYLLSKYVSYIRTARNSGNDEMPMILSPAFYALATAGIAPFAMEGELANYRLELRELNDYRPTAAATDNDQRLTFRSLRKMYQVALIGLLRNTSAKEQLKLVERVVTRSADMVEDTFTSTVWAAIELLVGQFNKNALELTPERRHFFTRFDRCLRDLSNGKSPEFNAGYNLQSLTELLFLLQLSGQSDYVEQNFASFLNAERLNWTDQQLAEQRKSVESGLRDSVAAISEAINELLVGVKQRLGAMSESQICEQPDLDYLHSTLSSIASVLSFCGFEQPASVLQNSHSEISGWQQGVPDQSALLEVANSVLIVENSLLSYALNSSEDLSLEDGMVEQAHQHLYTELQANISLVTRAVNSYIESNFDREHIANIHNCLMGAVGGFQIIGVDSAANLIQQCAQLIEREYKNAGKSKSQRLEKLADCLVTIEYLLHELSSGRKLDAVLDQLINESLKVLEHELAAG